MRLRQQRVATIGQWQRQPTAECSECGTTLKVDVSDVDRSVRAVDRGLADLDRRIRKLGS